MQWFLVHYVLLITTASVLSNHRPKRDLSYIKNLFSSKLLGNEIIVIQQPEIPKNQSYQLFKIKGYDNILLKVVRKPEKEKEEIVTEKVQEPVMVTPEIAIIGRYLGTSTQGETLLAIEIAKNFLKSGVLSEDREKIVQQVLEPPTPQVSYKKYFAPEAVNAVNMLPNEGESIYILPPLSQPERPKIVHRDSVPLFPEHPPLVIASELNYRPLQNKYVYKQKGETADMTYESYNNKDVIITRTSKEPPLPQYIKLRFADVATIGANPYFIRPQQTVKVVPEENLVQPINIVQTPYGYFNPSAMMQELQPAPIPRYVMGPPSKPKLVPSFEATEEFENRKDDINNPFDITNNTTHFSEILNVPSIIYKNQITHEDTHQTNQFSNVNHNISKNSEISDSLSLSLSKTKVFENEQNNHEDAKDYKSYIVPKPIEATSHENTYAYNQTNRISDDNASTNRVATLSEQNRTNTAETDSLMRHNKVPKDFVFIPPRNIDVTLPTTIPKINNIHQQTHANSTDVTSESKNDLNLFISNKLDELKTTRRNKGTYKTLKINNQRSSKISPVVVIDKKTDQKLNEEDSHKNNMTDFRPYLGGPVF